MPPLGRQTPGSSFLHYSSVDHCPRCDCSWQSTLRAFFCTSVAGTQESCLLTSPPGLSHQHQSWPSTNAGVLLSGHSHCASQHGRPRIPQSSVDSAHFPELFAVPSSLARGCLWDFQQHSSTTGLNHPRFSLVLVLFWYSGPSSDQLQETIPRRLH